MIGIVQLPDAASLDRTEKVVRQISALAKETPGVDHVIGFSGLSVQGFVNLSNAAVLFFPLKSFDERTTKDLSAGAIAQALNKKFSTIQDAVIFAVPPPPVQGFGTTGGFKLFIQDRGAHGYDELARVTDEVLNKARQQRELNPYATYTTFQNSVPQLFADVDRVKAKRQGVPLSDGVRYLAGLSGFGVRQRLQSLWPHLSASMRKPSRSSATSPKISPT